MSASGPHIHERVVFGVVILGGIAALAFGFVYTKGHITGPLAFEPKHIPTLYEQDMAAEQALRIKDTDQDGLVDYDELNIWQTSPYLPDSDSDGYDDKTEIDSGNDPNCPVGKECAAAAGSGMANAGEVEKETIVPPELLSPSGENQLFTSGSSLTDVTELFTNLPPNQIRELLIEYGVSKEELDKLSDEELLALYKQAVSEATADLQAQETAQP